MKTPSTPWSPVMAASCWGNAFLQQGLICHSAEISTFQQDNTKRAVWATMNCSCVRKIQLKPRSKSPIKVCGKIWKFLFTDSLNQCCPKPALKHRCPACFIHCTHKSNKRFELRSLQNSVTSWDSKANWISCAAAETFKCMFKISHLKHATPQRRLCRSVLDVQN